MECNEVKIMDNLLQLSSVTEAMRARDLLKKHRIRALVKRIPASKGRGACSYGLKIYGDYNKAEGILLQNGIMVHGRAPGEEYDLS